jgi:hypothetical protein
MKPAINPLFIGKMFRRGGLRRKMNEGGIRLINQLSLRGRENLRLSNGVGYVVAAELYSPVKNKDQLTNLLVCGIDLRSRVHVVLPFL